jgi:hypothetical protein
MAMDDRHRPHLTSQKPYAFDHRVGQTVEGDLVRTTGVVGRVVLLPYPLVPVIAVAIEGPDPMTIDADVIAAQNECRGLVLVPAR